MEKINEYVDFSQSPDSIIESLKDKSVCVPLWSDLRKVYDFREHAILKDNDNIRDRIRKDGTIERSSRLSLGMERLLVKRMSEFMFSIPVKREYLNTEGDQVKKDIAKALESIFKYARINNHNLKRSKDFFTCCEIMTLWYTVKSPNSLYGFKSDFKLKCKTFTPKDNIDLYPLFDEYGDMIAMSYQYTVTKKNKTVIYFETYTDHYHYKWMKADNGWEKESDPVEVRIGKIPAIYLSREEAIYDEVKDIRREIEYTLSKNSNVISYNSAPVLKVVGEIKGEEKKSEDYRLFRMEPGGDVSYVTWDQSVAAVTNHVEEMKEMFWSLCQLPDISFSNMKKLGNIGYDARETLLTDAHLKVGDESGDWIEFFDRETNIAKAFLKELKPEWKDKIDDVEVKHTITPFIQKNESTEIQKRISANGGKPIESQRESIQRYGMSKDPDETLKQIRDEELNSARNNVTDIFESMN